MVIYKVVNPVNNKVYIGQTAGQLSRRISVHRYQMNKGSKIYFIKALRKYGIDNFVWEIIDTASTMKELNEKESYWIKFLNSNDPSKGYNISLGGKNGKLNKMGVERIRKMRKGRKVSDIGRQRMSEAAKRRGVCITLEGRKKLRDIHKGNKYTARLNEEDVHEIFKLWNKGLTQEVIAVKFKVKQSNINVILKGKGWKEIYNIYYDKIQRKTRLSKEEIREIKKFKGIKSFKELAVLFNVSKSTISNVMNKESKFYAV